MADKELAEELLQIEEADAWFEYLEATRGQTGDPLRRGRAMGVGTSQSAPACRSWASCAAAPGRGVTFAPSATAKAPDRRDATPSPVAPGGDLADTLAPRPY